MKFDENIEKIEEIIGYRFRDTALLRQAFTRTSYCNEFSKRKGERPQSSEVLEFIGDSVLSTSIITLLMRERSRRYEFGLFTELGEGDFSNIKAALSNKHNLSVSTARLGLQKYLIMGEGDERLGIGEQPSVMEDLFESIIGAIYIDCGMELAPVIASVSKMLDVSVYKTQHGSRAVSQSAKNELQEWCADKSRRLPAPRYETLSESGPEHSKSYVRGCYIGDVLYGKGEGKNQKLADTAAAAATLELLRLEATEKKGGDTSLESLRLLAAEGRRPAPVYKFMGESDSSTASEREFVYSCEAMGVTAEGKGKSKKEAKVSAARAILKMLGL